MQSPLLHLKLVDGQSANHNVISENTETYVHLCSILRCNSQNKQNDNIYILSIKVLLFYSFENYQHFGKKSV